MPFFVVGFDATLAVTSLFVSLRQPAAAACQHVPLCSAKKKKTLLNKVRSWEAN